MAFLYYLPGVSESQCNDELLSRGLGHVLKAVALTISDCVRGPDDGRGVVVSCGPAARTMYDPRSQEWRHVEWSRCWVGWFCDEPPGPNELAKKRQLPGFSVELADGKPWLIPVAKAFFESSGNLVWCNMLPRLAKCDTHGKWLRGDVVKQFRDVWDVAVRWEDSQERSLAATGDSDGPVSIDVDYADLISGAIVAISTNYAIGKQEIDAMQLLTEETAREILNAVIDLPTRIEWIKKKGQESAGTSSSVSRAA